MRNNYIFINEKLEDSGTADSKGKTKFTLHECRSLILNKNSNFRLSTVVRLNNIRLFKLICAAGKFFQL